MIIDLYLVKLHCQPDFFIKKIEKEADMQKDRLRNLNPNHLDECHALGLQNYFGDSPFFLS
jgi:hypothetical protein